MSRSSGSNDVRIRAATPADAAAIAHVHVQAWHETYRGLVSDDFLATLSVERNTDLWADIIASQAIVRVAHHMHTTGTLPAEGEDADRSTIVGLGSAAAARDQALGTDGEVTAIYLLDGAKHRGVGRALFGDLLRALAARGHRSAGLWVLVENAQARRFYEAAGGRTGAMRHFDYAGTVLHEIAYVWNDLTLCLPT